jgi:cation:H+ antiporter
VVSVPELAIGIDAAVSGSPGLAVGNIVGTNLVNILLILGLSALPVPVAFERATLRFDLPAMTAAALLLFLLSIDGKLTRLGGGILRLGGVAYTTGVWCGSAVGRHPTWPRPSRHGCGGHRPAAAAPSAAPGRRHGRGRRGRRAAVDGAVSSARALGVSDTVIGLTIGAIGTSAPELVTTIMSTLRGDRDIAIGNLSCSNSYRIGPSSALHATQRLKHPPTRQLP